MVAVRSSLRYPKQIREFALNPLTGCTRQHYTLRRVQSHFHWISGGAGYHLMTVISLVTGSELVDDLASVSKVLLQFHDIRITFRSTDNLAQVGILLVFQFPEAETRKMVLPTPRCSLVRVWLSESSLYSQCRQAAAVAGISVKC